MKNALMLGRINWNKVSSDSSLLEIQDAISQTQEVMLANRVTLLQYQIDIPYDNMMHNLRKLEKGKLMSR
jgi:hypothetical protein